ncbi:Protein of unknown function DUF2304 [Methanocaldococcus infernus ME]|uniref:DUF2304 domain-containing protein n=1 Tax=Methanocaldococcus infernus (strain DSM 11812 / JCM 15783 / ME) TaxID=573063 RepID=D5VQS6_METIM|nr:DUF2304 family protein [Methanocaldococcus infernus]ADG12929.1 Protein of unknown function DUF2304 [Methanocaldococcus infernus ME]
MELIQIVGLIIILFALTRVIKQIKKKSMELEEGIFWLFVWLLALLIVIFPNFMSYLATVLGVGRGVDVIIYLSIILLFYLVYRIYARLEKLEREITKIVREIAIRDRYEPKKRD